MVCGPENFVLAFGNIGEIIRKRACFAKHTVCVIPTLLRTSSTIVSLSLTFVKISPTVTADFADCTDKDILFCVICAICGYKEKCIVYKESF